MSLNYPNSISEMTTATSMLSVFQSNLFLASQQDKYSRNKFKSCAISGQSLFEILMDEVVNMQNFNNTAYMTSSSFSPKIHNHDILYNAVSVNLCCASERTHERLSTASNLFAFKDVLPDEHVLSIGNIFIDGVFAPIEVPLSTVSDKKKVIFEAAEPMVGALKLVASPVAKSNRQISYESDSFDGWLYPDGSTFPLNQFALSAQLDALYGNGDGEKFTLPNLSNFLRMNYKPDSDNTSQIQEVEKHNVLKKHTHYVSFNGEIDEIVRISAVGNLSSPAEAGSKGGTVKCYGNGYLSVYPFNQNYTFYYSDGSYEPKNYTFSELQNILGITDKDKYSDVVLRVNAADKLLSAIQRSNLLCADSRYNPNTDAIYDDFKKFSTIKMMPFTQHTWLSAKCTDTRNVTLQYYGDDNEETYPYHVVMPVMIYVGQRKRDFA